MSHEGFVKYPLIGSLGSWYNQASSTWTQVGNSYNLYCPVAGTAEALTGRYDAPPSTPYTVIARVVPNPTDTTGLRLVGGLGFSDGTKAILINTRYQSSTYTSAWAVTYFSNSTTASSNLAGYQVGPGFPWAALGWMAIRNDGTNIYFYIGDESGQNFYEIYNEAKGSHLGTINEVGIYIDHGTTEGATDVMVESWRLIGV